MNGRVAIISDIHSNLQALEAVIADLERENPDVVYCLGDIVGYGAEPNECAEVVRSVADGRVILGNHDLVTVDPPPDYLESFNPDARVAVEYQRERLSETNISWLAGLPESLNEGEYLFYHGSPVSTDHYLTSSSDLFQALNALDGVDFRLLFFGHTHVPTAIAVSSEGPFLANSRFEPESEVETVLALEDDARYLINPGSVGQPRDRNSASAYAVVDLDEEIVRFRRVEYDIAEAQRRILDAGLPAFLAQRLEFGF